MTPAAGAPDVGWQLSAAELVALSDVVTGHIGYPEIDQWWAALDDAQRRDVYRQGLEALGLRGEDHDLRDAFRLRRDAVCVLVVEPSAGDVLAANLGADGRVVLERVRLDRGLDLLLLSLDEAVEVLIGALRAGVGGTIESLPLPQPAPGRMAAVVPSGAGWSWRTATFETPLTTAELAGALTLLARPPAEVEAATAAR